MRLIYTLKYVWNDLWHKSNRPFTLINLIAISIATTVLVILLGGFLAFQKNGEQLMDKLGLSIEVHTKQEGTISEDLLAEIKQLPGADTVHSWSPIIFIIYTKQGRAYEGISGRTTDLDDPVFDSLKDIRTNQKVTFFSKNQLAQKSYDEIGIIIPFIILKNLGYLPHSAELNKPETWLNEEYPLPEKIRFRIRENKSEAKAIDVEIKIIGIVPDIEGGRYLMTKDCFRILGNGWKNEFRPLLRDRFNQPIFPGIIGESSTAWENLNKIPVPADTHLTVYAKSRNAIIPLLKEIRNRNLKANCAIEHHLSEYQQQETFFLAAGGGICIIMFFFSGVILFSTFQALVLRKLQEIGLLKACGASKRLVYTLFCLQATLVCGMASILGMATGALCASKMGDLIQKSLKLPNSQWFYLPIEFMVGIIAVGIIFGILVTFFPVQSAVKIDPDSVIRI